MFINTKAEAKIASSPHSAGENKMLTPEQIAENNRRYQEHRAAQRAANARQQAEREALRQAHKVEQARKRAAAVEGTWLEPILTAKTSADFEALQKAIPDTAAYLKYNAALHECVMAAWAGVGVTEALEVVWALILA